MVVHFAVLPSDILQLVSAPQFPLDQTMQCNDSIQAAGRLRYLRLPHPRTGLQALFLTAVPPSVSPFSTEPVKVLEVQAVAPPEERTWFLGDEVISDGKLLIMTPIDPAFLLVPILQVLQPVDGSVGNFLPADDMFEEAASKIDASSRSLLTSPDSTENTGISNDILTFTSLICARKALKNVCEIKEITPEIVVYRFSPAILLHYLHSKVDKILSSHMLETSRTVIRGMAKEGLMEDGKENLLELARTRATCDLLSQYLPSNVRTELLASYDFRTLDEYLKKSFDETAALSLVASNTTKNKVVVGAENDEKKRKNTKGSQGVEKLKKVNVNGMAKLSSFFKKSEATR